MERRNPIRLFVLACACLAGTPATAQEQSPAWLGVYAEHHGGDVLYRYALGNRGRQALRAFRLGCDCPAADAEAGELPALPAGAWPEHEDARGVWYALAPEGVRAPPGWRARLRWPAGASGYWIEWYAADPRAGGPPGSSRAGFVPRVPGGPPAFVEAPFSADRARGPRPTGLAGAPALAGRRVRLLDRMVRGGPAGGGPPRLVPGRIRAPGAGRPPGISGSAFQRRPRRRPAPAAARSRAADACPRGARRRCARGDVGAHRRRSERRPGSGAARHARSGGPGPARPGGPGRLDRDLLRDRRFRQPRHRTHARTSPRRPDR